jgi:hypothetical protein
MHDDSEGEDIILGDDNIGHPVDFCLWGWMNNKFYKKEVDTPDELLAPIIVAAASITKRTKPDLRTGFAKFIMVDDGIYGYL